MREIFVIFLVILVLAALTALKYRKQIAGIMGVARMLKEAKENATQARAVNTGQESIQLVNCAHCGVWVPQSKAMGRGDRSYCSNKCQQESLKARP